MQYQRLPSGLRLVVDPNPHASSVAIGFWINAGSRQDRPGREGTAHALEHMAFKGSLTRSGEEIARAIDAVGGELDAYTSREMTAYYAQVLPDDVDLGLSLVADLALFPRLEQADWQVEQEVICHEIDQSQDTPDDVIFDYFQATCFPGQRLGESILGSAQTVKAISLEDLKAFRQAYYCPQHMILAAAGPITMAQLQQLAAPYIAALEQAQPKAQALQATDDVSAFQSGLFLQGRAMEQVQLLLGWPIAAQASPQSYAFVLLSHMLGYGGASLLFTEIREKLGLAYMIYASAQFFSDAGLMFIHASTSAPQLTALHGAIMQLMSDLPTRLTQDDLNRAKAQYRAGTLMARDSVSACARAAAHQLAFCDPPMPLADVLAKAEQVTLAEVQALAASMVATQPTMAALGPRAQIDALAQHHKAQPQPHT